MRDPTDVKSPLSARARWAAYAVVIVLVALAGAPMLRAGFHAEDFSWLALARHLDAPWELFYRNAAFAYFYRPVGLLFWRLCAGIAGTDAWLHNALDLALNAIDAGLVAMLAMRLGRDVRTGLFAGALFACLPVVSVTAAWMSDRFDPVALLFALLALLAFDRAQTRPRWTVPASLLLLASLNAKEVGYAAAAVLLFWEGCRWLERRQRATGRWVAILLPVAVSLLLHAQVAMMGADTVDPSRALQILLLGTGRWWGRLPAALYGGAPPGTIDLVLLAAAGLLVLAGLALAVRDRRRDTVRLGATGVMLLCLAAPLQAPIIHSVLADPTALAYSTNLRFYYFAAAGLALVWAAGHLGLRAAIARGLLTVLSIALAAQWLLASRALNHAWAQETRASSTQYLAVGRALGALTFEPGCRIELDAPELPYLFNPFSDPIVKAGAANGSSVLGCAVFTKQIPYTSIVAGNRCSEASWPGFKVRTVNGTPLFSRLGNLCMVVFEAEPPSADDRTRVYRFSVDAAGTPHALGP